ncbi:MAG: hypothetical protein ABGW69_00345 [Nanoarchaeota archaeon]
MVEHIDYLITDLVEDKPKEIKGWKLEVSCCPIIYSTIKEYKGIKFKLYIRSRWGYPYQLRIMYWDEKQKDWDYVEWKDYFEEYSKKCFREEQYKEAIEEAEKIWEKLKDKIYEKLNNSKPK